MTVVQAPGEPTHTVGGVRFTSLATPTRGATDTAVWQVEIPPDTPGTPHSLTREEVFVVLSGTAGVVVDGADDTAGPGDVIIVHPGTEFELMNRGRDPLRLLCCMPVGGQARLTDGTVFTPPWAE